MSREEDAELIAELEEANARLSESLKRCRRLVSDCHAKLAANSNENEAGQAGEDKAFRWPAKKPTS